MKLTIKLINEIREYRRKDPLATTGEIARAIGCAEYQVVSALRKG